MSMVVTGNNTAMKPITTSDNTKTNREKDPAKLMTGNRSMKNAFADPPSPLECFVSAKKRINEIYGEIEEYLVESSEFINALQSKTQIVCKAEREFFESSIPWMSKIRKILLRAHMKVAFFGGTSNGKTSVINAMLREQILPSGIGQTTNCFCQIEGSDGQDAYLMMEGSEEKLNVVNINQLENALCHEKRNENSLVRIFWPRTCCRLLRNDVVLVDSPGVDGTANLDDNHCLNADVFVLVRNGESTISRAEKQFFRTISQKLSEPNIFILNNRWDEFANEPKRQQSIKLLRCIDFLTKELMVSNAKEAAERVFFVSAREMLEARLEEAKGNRPNMGAIAKGFHIRYVEFQEFERKFEECIAQSAVRTNFEQHSSLGKTVASDLRTILDDIYERTCIFRRLKLNQRSVLKKRIEAIEMRMMSETRAMMLKIDNIVEKVEKKVSKVLNEEVSRLGVMIDELNTPFHTDPLVLNIYKKELNAYVESGLGTKLRARLSTMLAMKIKATKCEMTALISDLKANLDIEKSNTKELGKALNSSEALIAVRPQPFEMLYTLNYQNLCADFHEDLNFKFSWGITATIALFMRIVRERRPRKPQQRHRQKSIEQRIASPPRVNEAPLWFVSTPWGGITREQMSRISNFAITTIRSQSSVDRVLVACFGNPCFSLLETIGWRIPVGIGVFYGCSYLYQRLAWTIPAKQCAFKAQYARHATNKLKMIVGETAANCSHQVQQVLSNTFDRLLRGVDNTTNDMNEELIALESQLDMLQFSEMQLKCLRNRAMFIQNQLEIFEHNYIHQRELVQSGVRSGTTGSTLN